MPIRLSGMNSGLDTDAIVQELVTAYSKKTETYKKSQTKIEWKQEAWKSLNSKVYGLYTNISNLRFESAYNLKKTTVSDNTKATVSASSQAVTGTQKLNVLETAQAGYLTGAELKLKDTDGSDKKVTSDTTLADLGYTGGKTNITLKQNGKETAIEVSKDTKISELVKELQKADVNANFDEKNQRIFVSAKESGTEFDFDLVAKDEDSLNALSALGLSTSRVLKDESGNVIAYSDSIKAAAVYVSGDTKESCENTISNIHTLLQKYLVAKNDKKTAESENAEKQSILDAKAAYDNLQDLGIIDESGEVTLTSLLKKFDDNDDANGDYDKIKEYLSNCKIKTTDENGTEIESDISAEKVDEVIKNLKKVVGYQEKNSSDDIANLVSLEGINEEELTNAINTNKATIDDKDAIINGIPTVIKELGDSDVITDEMTDFDSIKESLKTQIDTLAQKAVEANKSMNDTNDTANRAYKISGADAKIKLNGVEYTNSSNSFSINGLNINAQVKTGDGDVNAISITTSSDVDGIYDTIKDFLTEYNTVINEITKLYNADSARDYQPLTDEEKDAMSETEVEKWEKKIKDSLLRRDSTLSEIMSTMTSAMSQSFEINGKNYSLSNFGIETLGFLNSPKNEQYAYHIDGDEDDTNTSGKEDKLRKAITEDSEIVMKFMQELTKKLYTDIDNKMKSTELSSAYKVYNDKELDSQYKDYTDLITKWEQKVSDKEEYYYKKFSQMEVALSKIQNQTNSLAGLLGS